jgi:hypothetical protein
VLLLLVVVVVLLVLGRRAGVALRPLLQQQAPTTAQHPRQMPSTRRVRARLRSVRLQRLRLLSAPAGSCRRSRRGVAAGGCLAAWACRHWTAMVMQTPAAAVMVMAVRMQQQQVVLLAVAAVLSAGEAGWAP